MLTFSLGVLLYVLRALTQEEQAEAINNMRNHIRAKYQDIRMRNDIIRDLWIFIDKVLDQQDDPPPPKKATGSKKGKKVRPRDDDMDTEDEEYKPKKQAKRK